jgi:hypothetical protein
MGRPLSEVHKDYVPVLTQPVIPISGLADAENQVIDLTAHVTDPDDEDDFTFEVLAISDPAVAESYVNGNSLVVDFRTPGQVNAVVRATNAGTYLDEQVVIGVQPVVSGETLVSTFEDLPLDPESYWNGADGSGSFRSGLARFHNTYIPEWFSWNGWACSNTSDISTPGFMNQYSAITGKGFDDGTSDGDNYSVSYITEPSVIDFTDGKPHAVKGFFVTNSTYAAQSMEHGDMYAKKFGGKDGTEPDYFKLSVWGRHHDTDTDTLEYYLADFRSENSIGDHIIKTWQWVDLSALGRVDSLLFTLSSSDMSYGWMNTPGYFCMDNLHVVPDQTPVGSPPYRDILLYPNPTGGEIIINTDHSKPVTVEIFNMTGSLIYRNQGYASGHVIDLSNRSRGSYLVRITDEGKIIRKKIIKY